MHPRAQRALSAVVMVIGLFSVAVLWVTGSSNILQLAVDLLAVYCIGWTILALLSEQPLARLRKRFVLVTGAILAVVLAAETPAWIRLIDYRTVFPTSRSEPWYRPDYVIDPELLWVHLPHHQHAEYREGNIGEMLCLPPSRQGYNARYDHNGFRNDVDLERAEIAVIGDSYIEAPMVPGTALMTSVLAELQQRRIANLGVVGYAPQQELAVLKRYAFELRPHVVVWVVVESNIPGAADYEEMTYNVLNDSRSIHVRWVRSFTRNALVALLRLPRGCTPNAYFERRYGILRQADGQPSRIYFPGEYGPLSNRDQEALEKTRAVLAEAYRLCRERGIRLIVLFSPREYRVYHDLPNLVEVSEEVKHYVVNDAADRLERMVADIAPDIAYLDLTPLFKAEAIKGTPIFLPDDTHWSPEGHRIAAHAIHKILSPGDRYRSAVYELPAPQS